MTFLETLQKSIGKLIMLKSQLFWHKKGAWDNNPGQIFLILDVKSYSEIWWGQTGGGFTAITENAKDRDPHTVGLLLLIDGSSQWIWINEKDVELFTNEPT